MGRGLLTFLQKIISRHQSRGPGCVTSDLDLSDDSVVMTAELAKPDSMEDLDKADEEEDYHEHYADDYSKHEDEEAEVEKRSLLTEDQKQGSSPSILLATATQNTNNDTNTNTPGSQPTKHDIAEDKDQGPRTSNTDTRNTRAKIRDLESGRCYSVCGPRPIKVSVLCLLIISLWVLLVVIFHLDKKMNNVQTSLESTEEILRTMEDSSNIFRKNSAKQLRNLRDKVNHLIGILSKEKRSSRKKESTTSRTVSTTSSNNSNSDLFHEDWDW